MSLPPLPLIEGALFVDNSMIELLTTCPRALEYNKLWQRIAAAEKPSLNFGSAIHLGLEHRYRHYKNMPVGEEYTRDVSVMLTQFFQEHPTPVDDWRNLNWAMETLCRYNSRYSLEEFNLLTDSKGDVYVELAFSLELCVIDGIRVMYSGRIDLPVMLDNKVFVIDHKTTSMFGAPFWDKMKMSAQQKGYAWSFEKITGQTVHGYIINAIRSKEPPQYVTNGTTTKSGKAMTPETWWQESLQRERFYIKPGELEEWRLNVIALIEEFMWHYKRGYMPQKTAWCAIFGRCQYFDVCSLNKQDRGAYLASGLFTENSWSPLKSPTQTKQ